MANRSLLHKSKMEDFKAWLTVNSINHRPGRGDWQILQVQTLDGWQVIYERAHMPEHVTVPEPLTNIVLRFIHK